MEKSSLLTNTSVHELHTVLLEFDQQLAQTVQNYMDDVRHTNTGIPQLHQPRSSPHVSMDYQVCVCLCVNVFCVQLIINNKPVY